MSKTCSRSLGWMSVATRQQPLPAPALAVCDADYIPIAADISEPSTAHSSDGSTQQPDAPIAPVPDTELQVEDTTSPATGTRSGRVVKQKKSSLPKSQSSPGRSECPKKQHVPGPLDGCRNTTAASSGTRTSGTRSGHIMKQNPPFENHKTHLRHFLRTYESPCALAHELLQSSQGIPSSPNRFNLSEGAWT